MERKQENYDIAVIPIWSIYINLEARNYYVKPKKQVKRVSEDYILSHLFTSGYMIV